MVALFEIAAKKFKYFSLGFYLTHIKEQYLAFYLLSNVLSCFFFVLYQLLKLYILFFVSAIFHLFNIISALKKMYSVEGSIVHDL